MQLPSDLGAPFLLLLQSEPPGGVKDVGRQQSAVNCGAAGGTDDSRQDGVLSCRRDTSQTRGRGQPAQRFILTFTAEFNLNW